MYCVKCKRKTETKDIRTSSVKIIGLCFEVYALYVERLKLNS